MTSLASIIQNHLAYDAWANGRLLDAAEKLTPEQLNHDFGTADKSIKGTLVHVFRSGRTWLRRVEQGAPTSPFSVPEDEEWSTLRSKWTVVQHRWQEWTSCLSDTDIHRVLEYTDLKGNPWAQPVWQIVLHVVNHATHHRGQVSAFLRASREVPPPLDFIFFMRQQQPK